MYQDHSFAAILLLGGKGIRFSDTIPKQFHHLSGKPIYIHTLETFLSIHEIDTIYLIAHKDHLEEVKEKCVPLSDKIQVIEGGKTRQESSFIGIKAASKYEYVIIHDGVRPFVSKKIIKENMKQVLLHKAVDTCIPSSDTIIEKKKSYIETIKDRSIYMRGQTPQTFYRPLILDAHKNGKNKNATDDCSLVMEIGEKIHIAVGDEYNIKITTHLDLFLAEQIFRLRKKEHISPEKRTAIRDKKIAVVGASGGIGSAICHLLQEKGAIPIPLFRKGNIPIDLCSPKSIKNAFEEVLIQHGPIDGLINSAGFLKISPLKKLALKEIEKMIQINFLGAILCCKYADIKEGGSIINIASSSFSLGRKDYGIYSASKAGLVNFTQSLAKEYPNHFINTVIPKRTDTPMRRKNFPDEKKETLLDPKKVAAVIIDLLEESTTTGSLIDIKG